MTTIRKRIALLAGLAIVTASLAAVAFPHEPAPPSAATHAVSALPTHAPVPSQVPGAPMPFELLGFALLGVTEKVKVGWKRARAAKSPGIPLFLASDVQVVRFNDKGEKVIVDVPGGRPLEHVMELNDDEIDELTALRAIRYIKEDEAGALEARAAIDATNTLAAEQARELELLKARHEAATAALDEAGQLKTDEKKAALAEKQAKELATLQSKHVTALAKAQ